MCRCSILSAPSCYPTSSICCSTAIAGDGGLHASRDAFARHRDRIKLTAVDLLLTDEEVDLLRTPGERSSDPASTIAPACRVATFVWVSDEERAGFLSAVLGEELPADLLLPLFVMASLGKGTFEDVAAFGPFGPDQDALLAE
ncbi:MAG: hypothetical protein ACLT98_16595, partial [Eggerthellaceae bacterium]